MLQNREHNDAGDLLKEVKEIQKIVQAKDVAGEIDTFTVGCGTFLTLRCC